MHVRFSTNRARKAIQRVEDPVHYTVLHYLQWSLPSDWLIHHSKNEGMSKAENGKAKAKGTLEGYPDLIIHGRKDVGVLTPIIMPFSWLVEIKPDDPAKVAKYKPSTKQRERHRQFRALGFPVAVAWSIESMRELVLEWGLPSTDYLVVRAREKAPQGVMPAEPYSREPVPAEPGISQT